MRTIYGLREYRIVDSFLVNHEKVCPGFHIVPMKHGNFVLGVCNKCGKDFECYDMRYKPLRVVDFESA